MQNSSSMRCLQSSAELNADAECLRQTQRMPVYPVKQAAPREVHREVRAAFLRLTDPVDRDRGSSLIGRLVRSSRIPQTTGGAGS